MHEGQKKFKCQYCGKYYGDAKGMKKHINNHHTEGNPEEIEPQNTGARITLHNESNPNSTDLDSTMNHTPIPLNADGTSIQIISSPFHIPHTQILPTGTSI